MSVFDPISRKGKWHCTKCDTWCMNEAKTCSFCSAKPPVSKPTINRQPPTPPPSPPAAQEKSKEVEPKVVEPKVVNYDEIRARAFNDVALLFEGDQLKPLESLKLYIEGCVNHIKTPEADV